MRRWLVGCIVAPLALCVTCAGLGYFVALPRVQTAASNQMADAVSTSVAGRIAANTDPPGMLVLRPDDLNVNNDVASGCGIDVTNSGTRIYGVVTVISPAGITLRCAGNQDLSYSAVPVVEGDRVELTEVTTSSNWMRFFLPKGKFERGMEEGINRALDAQGVTPTSITLRDGSMTIFTESTANQRALWS